MSCSIVQFFSDPFLIDIVSIDGLFLINNLTQKVGDAINQFVRHIDGSILKYALK